MEQYRLQDVVKVFEHDLAPEDFHTWRATTNSTMPRIGTEGRRREAETGGIGDDGEMRGEERRGEDRRGEERGGWERRVEGRMGGWTEERMDLGTYRTEDGGRTDGRTEGRTDGRTDRRTHGRTDGRTDRQTDRQTYKQAYRQTGRLSSSSSPCIVIIIMRGFKLRSVVVIVMVVVMAVGCISPLVAISERIFEISTRFHLCRCFASCNGQVLLLWSSRKDYYWM